VKHGLIFDLDGTLVDSLEGIAASLNHALAASGSPTHSLSAVRGFIGNGARVLVERAAPAGAEESLIESLEKEFKDHYELHWPAGTTPYDGVLPLLETLRNRGYPLAVLSNKPHPFTTEMVSRLFPTIQFSAVLGQRAGIAHKPDPAGAIEISRNFGLDPRDCVVIGDSTMDIETAHNAGMDSIAVTWGFHERERLIESKPGRIAVNPEQISGFFP
jgi:phosphoglycolate phosphatase